MPRRAWYRRKRAWAAFVLVWLGAYVLGLGPLDYVAVKGRLPGWAAAAYRPLMAALGSTAGCRVSQASGITRWRLWWLAKGNPAWIGPYYEEWVRGHGPAGAEYRVSHGEWWFRVSVPPSAAD